MEPVFLSLDEVLEIHEQQIERYGAFIDGNKRVGANAAITFLLMNEWEPTFDEEELVDLVLSVAAGGPSKPRLIEIFESRCKPPEGL